VNFESLKLVALAYHKSFIGTTGKVELFDKLNSSCLLVLEEPLDIDGARTVLELAPAGSSSKAIAHQKWAELVAAEEVSKATSFKRLLEIKIQTSNPKIHLAIVEKGLKICKTDEDCARLLDLYPFLKEG